MWLKTQPSWRRNLLKITYSLNCMNSIRWWSEAQYSKRCRNSAAGALWLAGAHKARSSTRPKLLDMPGSIWKIKWLLSFQRNYPKWKLWTLAATGINSLAYSSQWSAGSAELYQLLPNSLSLQDHKVSTWLSHQTQSTRMQNHMSQKYLQWFI